MVLFIFKKFAILFLYWIQNDDVIIPLIGPNLKTAHPCAITFIHLQPRPRRSLQRYKLPSRIMQPFPPNPTTYDVTHQPRPYLKKNDTYDFFHI